MNSVEVDLVLLKEVMIWRTVVLKMMFPLGVLVALEGLKSKSDKTYGFGESVPVDRNPLCALSMVAALNILFWNSRPKLNVMIFQPP
jgi:hypothetical protein